MTTKRRGLIAGGLLAGAILVGTAGIAAAQDPTASPTTNPAWTGSGMMSGQGAAGMMGGQGAAGMMGGQMGSLTPEQLKEMAALHDEMVKSGTCDTAKMQAFHDQLKTTR